MTPEFARLNVCLNCGGVLLDDGSCPGCGWSEQEQSPPARAGHRYQYTGLSDEEPYSYDDRFDPTSQACQTVDQVGDLWSDYASSIEMDEPQREMYENGLELNESLKHDVDRLVKMTEQQAKMIERVLGVLDKSKYVVGTISWIAAFLYFYRSVFLPTMEATSAALFSLIISAIIGYLMGFPGYKWLLEQLLSYKPPSPPSSD